MTKPTDKKRKSLTENFRVNKSSIQFDIINILLNNAVSNMTVGVIEEVLELI